MARTQPDVVQPVTITVSQCAACDLEQARRVHGRALDQLGSPELERGVGERVLQVDDQNGGSRARLDAGLAVPALDPGIVGRKLECHGARWPVGA